MKDSASNTDRNGNNAWVGVQKKKDSHNVINVRNYKNVLTQMSGIVFSDGKIIIPVMLIGSCLHAGHMGKEYFRRQIDSLLL